MLFPSAVKRKLAALQSMLTFAVRPGYIPPNTADARRLTLPKQIQPEIQIFTKQEAAQIPNCLQNEAVAVSSTCSACDLHGSASG